MEGSEVISITIIYEVFDMPLSGSSFLVFHLSVWKGIFLYLQILPSVDNESDLMIP